MEEEEENEKLQTGHKAYRFRIYPNAAQRDLFARTFGCCRFIYNRMLSDKILHYQECRKMLKCTPAGYKKEFPWLKKVDSLALANVQLDLEGAFNKFFREKGVGFPKFKAKHRCRKSYTTNMVNGNIRLEAGHLRLPKAGTVKIIVHRRVPEEYRLKSVTVSQEPSGEYYASLLYEYCRSENQAAADPESCSILGIDFAMNGMAVFSDGSRSDYPGYYRRGEAKLKREQRKLSHCEKGSRNYIRQKKKVAGCHQKVKNQRKDYHHKLSRRLADRYQVIAAEDLDLKAMSRSMHYGKSVMDDGYGQFLNFLAYKLDENGGQLIRIGRFFPSSKTCSCCGTVKKDLKLSERIYRCGCGCEMDRDVNAAVNIREEGRRLLCG